MIKLKDILELTGGSSYGADPGEPDTGFLAGGEKRTLGTLKGKPEPWFEEGGYTQLHFPESDHIYGKGNPADYKAIKRVLIDHEIKLKDLMEAGRIPRKKGQKRNSKKHSDLYTDENPKGTIHGLKFATVKDAEASIRKIKSSGRKHAHKVQAAVAMEQRAKAAGKKSAAAVYRKYINSVKKTEADLHSKLSRGHKPDYYQLGTAEFKPFDKSRDDVEENFADGKKPGRKGISKRVGIPKGATLTQLAKLAKAKGEKGRMARWQLNMRRGKKKK